MRAGRLDRRIHILERGDERSATTGELVPVWVVLLSRWARRVPKGSAERVLGRELVSEDSITWSIRYTDQVHAKQKLRYAGDDYHITGVYEADSRRQELLIVTSKESPERDAVVA